MPETVLNRPKFLKDQRLILLCLFLFLTLTAWGFSSPVGSSPDDDYHLPSIWCSNGEKDGICKVENTIYQTPGGVSNSSRCFAFDPNKTGECTFKAMLGESQSQEYINNNLRWYPDLFYRTMNLAVSANVADSTMRIRLINSAIFCFLIFLFFKMKVKERIKENTKLVLGLLFVPMGFFIIPSTNPSSWSFGVGLLLIGALFNWIPDKGKSIPLTVFVFLLSFLFLGARADSGGYLIISIIVILISNLKDIRSLSMSKILGLAILIFLSLQNLFSYYGQKVINEGLLDHTDANRESRQSIWLALYNLVKLPELIFGIFGTTGLGWLDTLMPLIVPLLVIVSITVIVSILKFGSNLSGTTVSISMLILIPMYVLSKGNNLVGEHVQSRYLMPIICLLAFSYLGGISELEIPLVTLRLIAVFMSIAHMVSLYTNISRYSVGINRNIFISSTNWQWPFASPQVVFFAGTIFGTLFFWFLFSSIKTTPEVEVNLSQSKPNRR